MPILLTGATGFVIANLARHLAEHGHDIVAADLKPPDPPLRQFLEGLPGSVSFHHLDVTDRAATRALVREVRPERAVHGAAITAIPSDVERSRFVETVEANVMGTVHTLTALAEAGTGRIVAISSGSVYGRREHLSPISEDDAKDPPALYAMTKWAGDMLARRLALVRGLDVAVARLASPFGPFERDTGSRPLLSPIAHWAEAAVKGQPVVVTGDATAERDVVYVGDIAGGIAGILLADRLAHDSYNVGWGRGTSAEEAVAALRSIVPGLAVDWRPDQPSPWQSPPNVPRGPLRCERLRRDLGWEPRYTLESGLVEYVGWLRRQS